MTFRICVFFCITLITGCREGDGFQRTKEGLEYKIAHQNKDGMMVQNGEYLKLSTTQILGDTILRDPQKTGFEYQYIDSGQMSKDAWKIFTKVRTGDSLVFRFPQDSAFKRPFPDFVKRRKGAWLETRVKVIGVLANADSVRADRERFLGRR